MTRYSPPRSFACVLICATLAAALAGCAAPVSAPPSLYDRLGGEARLAAVVSKLVERAAADPRTRRSFDGVKLATLKKSIVQQICSLAGGGCPYEGETMRDAHRDLRIAASEFDALVGLLRDELDRAGVDGGAKNELLRLLAPMKRDIVAAASRQARHA